MIAPDPLSLRKLSMTLSIILVEPINERYGRANLAPFPSNCIYYKRYRYSTRINGAYVQRFFFSMYEVSVSIFKS